VAEVATRRSVHGVDEHTPVFVISVAAELAGMHAQTLRQYDRLGLVVPSRTRGGGRRYSARDIELLREIQRLSQEEGVSLPGIARILELENAVEALRSRVTELTEALEEAEVAAGRRQTSRFFRVSSTGDAVAMRVPQRMPNAEGGALVVWRPERQARTPRG
jgi:MerR family transcriptional regulator/heat shock protein HspR